MSAIALQLDGQPGKQDPQTKLRKACSEFVSMATFGQMLREARKSSLNSGLWNSSAEKIFNQQLDDVLLQRASDKLGKSVGEGLYRQLSRSLPSQRGGAGPQKPEART